MGNDTSAPSLPFAKSLPQSGGLQDWPVPPMVLYIDHLVLPKPDIRKTSSTFAALVRFDGEDVSDGVLFKVPSGPIPLLPREKGQCIHIRLYHEGVEKANLSQAQAGGGSALSMPTVAGNLWPYAEIECSISQLIHYGAPLYTSLWLGMRLGTSFHQESTEDLTDALEMARSPNTAKIKLTLFRPVEDMREKRAAARSQSPMARSLSPRLSKHNQRAEPDIENMLGQKSFFERDLWDNFNHLGIKDFRIAMVQGLIRCLDQSNAVIQKLQAEPHEYVGSFQAIDKKESADDVPAEAVLQELYSFKLALKALGYEDLIPLAAGEALEAVMRRKVDEQDCSLAQLRAVHDNQLRHLQDFHDGQLSKASSEYDRLVMEIKAESEQRLEQARNEFAQQLREAAEAAEAKLQEQRVFYERALTEASRGEMKERQEEAMREQDTFIAESLRQDLDQMSRLHKQELLDLRDESEREKYEAMAAERESHKEAMSCTMQDCARELWEAASEIKRLKRENELSGEELEVAQQEHEQRLADALHFEMNRMSHLHNHELEDLREAQEAAANEIERLKQEHAVRGADIEAAKREQEKRLAESWRLELDRKSQLHSHDLLALRDEFEQQKREATAAERKSHNEAMASIMQDWEHRLKEGQKAATSEIERIKREHDVVAEGFSAAHHEQEKHVAETMRELGRMSHLHNQEMAALQNDLERQKREALATEQEVYKKAMSCMVQDYEHKLHEAQQAAAREVQKLQTRQDLIIEELRINQAGHGNSSWRHDKEATLVEAEIVRNSEPAGSQVATREPAEPLKPIIRSVSPLRPGALSPLRPASPIRPAASSVMRSASSLDAPQINTSGKAGPIIYSNVSGNTMPVATSPRQVQVSTLPLGAAPVDHFIGGSSPRHVRAGTTPQRCAGAFQNVTRKSSTHVPLPKAAIGVGTGYGQQSRSAPHPAGQAPGAMVVFDLLDKNHDGVITRAEFNSTFR